MVFHGRRRLGAAVGADRSGWRSGLVGGVPGAVMVSIALVAIGPRAATSAPTRALGAPQSAADTSNGRAPSRASTVRGEALFGGAEPLRGRIRGHQSGLPPEVLRCINCHGPGKRAAAGIVPVPLPVPPPLPPSAPAPAPAGGVPVVAAPVAVNRLLLRALLLEQRERRGGPPSTYDAASFCKLLRTGVDPSYILIAREMPTFEIDDAACAALWQFLTGDVRRVR